MSRKRNPFPNTAPLEALESDAWQIEDTSSLEQQHYFMSETDPRDGRTLALMQITIDPERFIRIVNTDLSVFRSDGFKRLLKHKSRGFGFISLSETKLILSSYKSSKETALSSSHDFAYSATGMVLDPPGAPSMDTAMEVLSKHQYKIISLDLTQTRGQQPPITSQLARGVPAPGLTFSCYLTASPVYSKTLLIHADSQLIFVKQNRAHFSKTEIDVARGRANSFFHYTQFDRTLGYESVCHYLGANPTTEMTA